MISYAQNLEDVMLWRALKHVEKGFYIDLGAQDPVVDSVSLAFHELGWKGVHVEPTPHYAQLLREQRPGDMVIEAAVGNATDMLKFFEIPDTGISTADPQIAQQHRERGFEIREIIVPCIRLSSIFKLCGKRDIQWMKIDVEGFEQSALASWGKTTVRPWIVVVESTLPMTQIESHQQWESLLLQRGYSSVYFDGLNRYYVSKAHGELRQAFCAPPNVFDDFSVNGTASTAIHRHLKSLHTAEVDALSAQVKCASNENSALHAHKNRLMIELSEICTKVQHTDIEIAALNANLNSRESALVELRQLDEAHHRDLLSAQKQLLYKSDLLVSAREEFAVGIEAATQEKFQSMQALVAREREFSTQVTAREQAHRTDISSLQAEAVRTSGLLIAAKDEFAFVLDAAQQEALKSLRALATREREFSEHAAAQEQEHRTKLSSLQEEVGRTSGSLLAARDEFASVLHAAQQEFGRRLDALHLEADRQKLELLRSHQLEVSALSQTLLVHERDFGARMRALHDDEIYRLNQLFSRQEHEFHTRSQEQTNNLLNMQAKEFLQLLDAEHAQRLLLQDETRTLREAATVLRSDFQLERELNVRLSRELSDSQIGYGNVEHARELASAQLAAEQELTTGLLKTVANIKREVDYIQGSYSWRLTAPLRRIFKFIASNTYRSDALPTPEIDAKCSRFQIITPPMKKISYSELACFDGEQFVDTCYLKLLLRPADPAGRAHYLSRLEDGENKVTIVESLVRSDEGRQVGVQVTDCDPSLANEIPETRSTNAASKAPSQVLNETFAMESITYAELARFNGEQFVENCYLKLLHRQADATGRAHYLSRLKAGEDQATIIDNLLRSDEGRFVGIQVTGYNPPPSSEIPETCSMEAAPGAELGGTLPMKNITYAQLASFNGEQFVENCYLQLLHRQADPTGKANYLSQLEDGADKVAIIESILGSKEGRRVGKRVGGLWPRSIRKKLEKWPVLGTFLSIQTNDLDQALRAMDNKLHRLIEAYAVSDKNYLDSSSPQPVVASFSTEPALRLPYSTVTLAQSSRASIFLVVDLKWLFASDAIRLLKNLGQTFLARGESIFFVYWNSETKNFYFVAREHLDKLELAVSAGDLAAHYPVNSENQAVIEPTICGIGDWLLVPKPMRILPGEPQLIEMDMIMEARRLGLCVAFIFHGAEPLRLKKFEGSDADAHEQYMQALLLADVIIPVSTFAGNDLKAFFVQHQKVESAPLIEEISLPMEGQGESSHRWSEYAVRVQGLLAYAANKSHHLATLYYWIDPVALPGADGCRFVQRLARALTECGIALIPVSWGKEDKQLVSAKDKCSDHMKLSCAPGSWAEWIEPGLAGAPQWVFRPQDVNGELLAEVTSFAKSRQLRTAALLQDSAEGQSNGGIGSPLSERDRRSFEALAGVDKVMVTSEQRFQHFYNFLLSWRGKIHSAEHRFKTLVSPNENPGQQQRSWSEYAREIASELATDRLTDTLRPIVSEAEADVYTTLVNLHRRPKLSVCISTYNRAGWVEVNLRNIFTQIGAPREDLEVLVVDNTSTDHTPNVIQPYLARPDFRYVRNPKNVGMLGNLAVTAQRAKGEYVWILGDDDLTRPGVIERVLQIIKRHPGIGLIYMNYGYTSEANPGNVTDLASFLTNYNKLEPAGPDEFAPVKRLAAKCENFFTAIYSHVYRRDHALKSYCQDTSGRIFSTMLSCVPTAYYVLNYMSDEPAYWIGEPSLVVNSNVSWQDYGVLLELEQLPRTWDLAERMGTPPGEVDCRRANRLWLVEMMWKEIFENDKAGNSAYFSASRSLMRLKHLPDIDKHIPEFRAIYERARATGHPAAIMPADELFSAFSSVPTLLSVSNAATIS